MLVDHLRETSEPLVSPTQPDLQPMQIDIPQRGNAAVIVAHPDDETLWAGGAILARPNYNWFIVTLCRKSDPDRSQKFFKAMQVYGAKGEMADLDDGPEQHPLELTDVKQKIVQILPALAFNIILTHSPSGEYTRHLRHEEVSQAVMDLWKAGAISTRELWLFAYEDDHGRHLPSAIETAHQFEILPEAIFQEKYRLVTEIYGFDQGSWEAKVVPRNEAFWRFASQLALDSWLEKSDGRK